MAFFNKQGPSQRPQGNFQRPMFQGNWTCSGCGAKITELPFQPSGDRPIYCRDCHRKQRDSQPGR